jgi:hypothetical protein
MPTIDQDVSSFYRTGQTTVDATAAPLDPGGDFNAKRGIYLQPSTDNSGQVYLVDSAAGLPADPVAAGSALC